MSDWLLALMLASALAGYLAGRSDEKKAQYDKSPR